MTPHSDGTPTEHGLSAHGAMVAVATTPNTLRVRLVFSDDIVRTALFELP
jgi:hypothetical protein